MTFDSRHVLWFACAVFVVLLINGIRFTMQVLHDARYGRIQLEDAADGPDSPTCVADL